MAHENGNLPRISTSVGVLFYTQDQTYDTKTCTDDTICLGCGHPVSHAGVMFIVSCDTCRAIKSAYNSKGSM